MLFRSGGNIDPGGNIDLTATFRPTAEGTIVAQLDFIFNIPCPDTLKKLITLAGEGRKGTIFYTNPVDFGVITPCDTILDSLVVVNTGSVPFTIVHEMRIEGGDYEYFRFFEPIRYVIIVQPGGRFVRKLVFDSKDSEGLRQSNCVIRIYIDGDTVEYTSKLIGKSQIGLDAIPPHIDFGNIVVNTISTKKLVLKNNGVNTVEITSLLPYPLLGIYLLVPNPLTILPVTLDPGDSIEFDIDFHPTVINQDYIDTLKFAIIEKDCQWVRNVSLFGKAYPAQTIKLRLPALTGVAPNIDNYRIPIYAILVDSTQTISGISIDAEFSMNATLFYPTSVEPGSLVSNTTSGKLRIISLRINNAQVSGTGERVIAEIVGATLLGETTATPMLWNTENYNVEPSTAVNNILFTDGNFSIAICEKGGSRLLNYDNVLSMSVAPNPANDLIEVNISVLEVGLHSLVLINPQGERKELQNWVVENDGIKTFNFVIQTNEISSGMYYLLLKSPVRSKVEPVFIIK